MVKQTSKVSVEPERALSSLKEVPVSSDKPATSDHDQNFYYVPSVKPDLQFTNVNFSNVKTNTLQHQTAEDIILKTELLDEKVSKKTDKSVSSKALNISLLENNSHIDDLKSNTNESDYVFSPQSSSELLPTDDSFTNNAKLKQTEIFSEFSEQVNQLMEEIPIENFAIIDEKQTQEVNLLNDGKTNQVTQLSVSSEDILADENTYHKKFMLKSDGLNKMHGTCGNEISLVNQLQGVNQEKSVYEDELLNDVCSNIDVQKQFKSAKLEQTIEIPNDILSSQNSEILEVNILEYSNIFKSSTETYESNNANSDSYIVDNMQDNRTRFITDTSVDSRENFTYVHRSIEVS